MNRLDAEPKKTRYDIKMDKEERIIRFCVKSAAITIIMFFLFVTSCTMHDTVYQAERLAEEAKIQKLQNERTLVFEETKRHKIDQMEKAISSGANPQSVRCAFFKPNTNTQVAACNRLGLLFPRVIVEPKQ